ncbi:MAG TPA: twin-arginine translocase TatA/TatE family subunit [Acidimicrobiales bacterium]|nr:twin-arginine translocase TatA/TatE family subunit [Acidimicrobiales bacterium]
MPSNLGPAEIIAILVVALIVLGPKRLPEAGRQVGRAIAEVRRWSQGFQSEVRNVIEAEPAVDGDRPPEPPVDRAAS